MSSVPDHVSAAAPAQTCTRHRGSSLPSDRRVRILSLDGGGVRGIITLQVLMRLEREIKAIDKTQSIRSCFDLICGTSIGGIIAMALVSTDVPLEEINKLFLRLPKEVFTGWDWLNKMRVSIGSALFLGNSKYSAEHLERFIDETFDPRGVGRTLAEAKNSENTDLCGFVTSARINNDVPQIYLHRTYAGETNGDTDVHQVTGTMTDADLGVTIRDALRATSAAPTYFPRISIDNGDGANLGTFVDGGFMANNPVELAVAEAYEKWPTRGVSTVLSVGCGMSKNEDDGTGSARSNINYALTAVQMATESQRAHARMCTQSKIIRLMAQEQVYSGLREMDANHDGMISAEEFHRYLAKFRIHKSLDSIAESFARFGEEQKIEGGARTLRDLFQVFKSELEEYHDFPEYFRLDAPHTLVVEKDGKKVERHIDLGSITLDTTDPKELQRMVDDTNAWLDTNEMVAKVRRIATRLAHSHVAVNNAIKALSPRD